VNINSGGGRRDHAKAAARTSHPRKAARSRWRCDAVAKSGDGVRGGSACEGAGAGGGAGAGRDWVWTGGAGGGGAWAGTRGAVWVDCAGARAGADGLAVAWAGGLAFSFHRDARAFTPMTKTGERHSRPSSSPSGSLKANEKEDTAPGP
jgi:hypothetical protein